MHKWRRELRGEIYSYTVVSNQDKRKLSGDFGSSVVALIRLENGEMIVSELTDLERVKVKKEMFFQGKSVGSIQVGVPVVEIGQIVEMVTRLYRTDAGVGDKERGGRVYGFKYRPVLE